MTADRSRPPPAALVDDAGRVALGLYDAALPRANLEDARLRWRGLPLPDLWARLRFKAWQHVALVLPDALLGLALVDVAYLRTSWCHVVDDAAGLRFEHKRTSPALDLRVGRELWDDRCHVRARGYQIVIENRMAAGEHRVAVTIDEARGCPAVSATLRCLDAPGAVAPLVAVLPMGEGRAMYTHKVALPVEGTLQIGERRRVLDAARCFAILDVHKAHYPRHTRWNWAAAAGRDAAGHALALNLTRNDCHDDDDELNENALWCDGRIQHLGAARFELDRRRVLEPWHVRTTDGAIDLTFTPHGERAENLRLGLVRSVFHQPHGVFSGVVRWGDQALPVHDLRGVCEEHDSLW